MPMIPQSGGEALQAAYRNYLLDLWVRRNKVGCLLVAAATPTGLLLDKFVYPEHFWLFAVVRLITILAALGIFALHYTAASQRYQPIAIGWMIVAAGHITLMIGLSEGVVSPYYIGLILLIMATGLLLPWTPKECLRGYVLILAMYAESCFAHAYFNGVPASERWLATAINNSLFLVLLSGIGLAGCYVTAASRFTEFKLRFELDQSQEKLEASYKKLSELDKAKSQFFANISHELRTPLTLIVSPLEALRSSGLGQTDPSLREKLDIMYGNAMRLLALINDLLDLMRLEEGRLALNLEPVDLKAVLPGLVGSMRGAAERAKLTLVTDLDASAPLVVAADKDRLEKIFINLLFNAIKFTGEGGTVRLSGRRENEKVLVDVQDTGQGIAAEHVNFVFDRFWQADGSSTRARQGTGIGLALVKELVELHKGSVSVASQQGVGSTFSVRFPAYEGSVLPRAEAKKEAWLSDLYRKSQHYQGTFAASQGAESESLPRSTIRHTLLLVEDELDMQRYLIQELQQTYNVVAAPDGEAGYELAVKCRPQLVLTDMMLPKTDGITLCRKIKTSPSIPPTRIVLLTARADDQTKLSALEAGADDFVTKPFSMVELKTRLANLLLTGQLERELQTQNQTLENTLQQLRATEAQLIQTERLSALGNLSAGIMHEINNPVNFMLTAIHFLRSSLRAGPADAKEAIDDIEGGLKRVRDIIADLKSFAYGGTSVEKKECDPQAILRTAKRLLAHDLHEGVELEERVSPDTTVYGNENQLVQLLVNLLQNALQATLGNPAKNKARRLKVRMETQQDQFVISISDNGIGIPKENLAKIFDPFFTTKQVGEGTGLGLSISHTIVKQHRGEIFARSEPGAFTEFAVRLPPYHLAGQAAAEPDAKTDLGSAPR